MIKVLIVDDERWVRLGLEKQADWAGLGMEIVGAAENGERALDIIKVNLPDIIITDIRMPVMDGLRLMEIVRGMYPDMIFIVLSGYTEFEYAKKAISLKATGYIVKPVEEQELEAVLKKAVIIVAEQREKQQEREISEKQKDENMSFQRERLVNNFLLGIIKKTEKIKALFFEVGLLPNYVRYRVIAISVNNFYAMANEKYDFDYEYLSNSLFNAIKLIINSRQDILLIKNINREGEMFGIIGLLPQEKEAEKKVMQISNEISTGLKDNLDLDIVVGIGNEYSEIEDILKSYNESVQAVNCGLIFDRAVILYSKDIQSKQSEYNFEDNINHMLQNLELGNKELSLKVMNNIFNEIEAKNLISADGIKRLMLEMLVKMNMVARKSGFSIDELLGCENVHEIVMKGNTKLYVLKDLFNKIIGKIIDFDKDENKGLFSSKIPEIVEYVTRQYNENVNLESVATKFFVTSAYLSRVFKNETGQNFSKYLSEIRMKKSIELLEQNRDAKLNDIAAMVGYDNPEYFLKKFKQYYHLTPTEYKTKNFS